MTITPPRVSPSMLRSLIWALIPAGLAAGVWGASASWTTTDGYGPGGVQTGSSLDTAHDDRTVEDRMSEAVALLHLDGDPAGARRVLRTILQDEPTHHGALYQLALACERLGDLERTMDAWRRLAASARALDDPTRIQTAQERIAALEQRVVQLNEQVAASVQMIDDPAQIDRAVAQLETLLRVWPVHIDASEAYATALERSDQHASAVLAWTRLQNLARESKNAAALSRATLALERLGSARSP